MRALLFVCLVAAAAHADSSAAPVTSSEPPSAEVHARAARIAGATFVDGHALKILEDLSDRVGGRLTASPSYTKAVEWGQAQLRAAGVADVKLEPFTLEHGWLRGVARGRVVAPVEKPLHLESVGWGPATAKGGVRGEVVVVHELAPESLPAQLAAVRGKIVLYDPRPGPQRRSLKQLLKMKAALKAAHDAGVALVITEARDVMNNVVGTGSYEWGGKLTPLPMAVLGQEDSQMLVRYAERGPVTVEIDLPNRVAGPTQAASVVGELRGTERPEEWILIGAHLDSWDFATGSQDNGAGVAQVIEVARVLAAAGPHKRTIRFALWGGEEQGLVGSLAYARAHEAELGRCVAILNTDNGAGHPKGWKVEARRDVEAALRPLAKALLHGLGADDIQMTRTFDTDHGPFMLYGVPVMDLLVDEGNYAQVHHKPSDTVDKVTEHNLEAGAAVVAVTAEALASSTAPFATHVDRAAVAEILKEDDLDQFLAAAGIWK